jgi:hypothetical protein
VVSVAGLQLTFTQGRLRIAALDRDEDDPRYKALVAKMNFPA